MTHSFVLNRLLVALFFITFFVNAADAAPKKKWRENIVRYCSPENAYLLGKNGEPMPTICPHGFMAAFKEKYQQGQQEFYRVSSFQDTINALDLQISEQEQQRQEIDNELSYLTDRIQQLQHLVKNENAAIAPQDEMLKWAKMEFVMQEKRRTIIEQEIGRLQQEKSSQQNQFNQSLM